MSSRKEQIFLEKLGQQIKSRILLGYDSPYDFWSQHPELEMSRVTLNSVINGRTDVRLTNLLKIARALQVGMAELLSFEKAKP